MFNEEKENLQRVREIVERFLEAGFTELMERTGLREKLPFGKRFFKKGDYEPGPERLRKALEDLGPTFIKLGQMLAQRPDIVPENYVSEMEKLEDQVETADTEDIKRIIEKEFGKPVKKIFESFDEKPVASASIAQVHKAVYDGKTVAVKIIKPEVRETVKTDLRILKVFLNHLDNFFGKLEKYHLLEIYEQFREWTLDEIDLRKESENMETVRTNFKKDRGIRIPEVYWDRTGRDVLTMEFIEGTRMRKDKLEESDIDVEKLADKGIKIVLKMVLRDGLFHGDPHPSNMRVDNEGRIVLMDFGIVGRIDRTIRQKMAVVMMHALGQDVDGVMRTLKDIADFSNAEDLNGFRKDIEKVVMKNPESRIGNNLVSKQFLKIVRKGVEKGVVFPTNLVAGGKSLLQAEGLGMVICPGYKPYRTVREEIRSIVIKQNSPKDIAKSFATSLVENRELIENSPRHIMDVVNSLKNLGELRLEEPINFSSKNIAVAIFGSVVLLSGSLTLSMSSNIYTTVLGSLEVFAGLVIGWFVLTE